ncbi:restriction endonuclease subunit S [Rhodobacter capsulatus]|uniref:restriction endonuclease subunit S n=1 Tax=Rhodobacter capsulatus TaxID=1061 RepID=UPI0003F97A11|nr:restriction endonuclease subunit S [Rhodobacter capsulatus]
MCDLVIDCPHFTPDWTNSGYIVLRNQNIRDGRLDLSTPSFTHKDDFDRRNRRAKPTPGDIVFTREAPMGEVCQIPEGLDCCLGQRQVLLRPKHEISSRYLFYAMQSPSVRHQIFWNEGTGSTVSNVRIPILKDLRIPRNDAEEAIAATLGVLDDKIELNRKMNATLEAMARTLFRDWFVDFGPTRAKMAGAAPYLSLDLWSLFPDRLDAEGKPEGWEESGLLDLATLISGGTPKTDKAEYWNGDIPWASAKDVSQCKDAFLIETERSISESGLKNSATKIIPKYATVVVARGATTGRSCMFGSDIAMNQTCYALTSRSGHRFWLNCAFRELVDRLVNAAHGSVFDTITTRTIEAVSLVQGPKELRDQFERMVTPLFQRLLANVIESRTLAQTRDLLLPRLMSGDLRVADIDLQTVEQA